MRKGAARLTMQRQVQVLIGGVALVMTAAIALIGGAIADQAARVEAFNRIVPAVDDVRALNAAIDRELQGARGFVATADEAVLQPYVDAREQSAVRFGRLQRELAGHPELVRQARDVETALLGWRRAVEPVLSEARNGRLTEATERLQSEGEPAFVPVRRSAARLATAVDAEVESAADEVSASRSTVALRVVFAAVTAAVLLVLGAMALRRWVVVPVRDLADQVTTVAGGELRRPIETVPGTGQELIQLGEAVNYLRRRLVDEIEALERANEALQQDAPVTLALRAQLAPVESAIPAAFEVAGRLVPAEGALAGDWYDLVPLPGGRLGVGIGDVCGHGAEAGLLALRAKVALLTALHSQRDPGEVLHDVAEAFGRPDSFVTAFVAVLDPATGECRYAGAGHPPALVVSRGDATRLTSTGPLIGMFDAEWVTGTATLHPNGSLVLYTDGVTEARDRQRREFGTAGVVHAIESRPDGSAEDQLEAVVEAVQAHDGGRLQDDVTIVVIKRRGVAAARSAPGAA